MRTLTLLIAGAIAFCFGTPPPASAGDKCAQWRVPQDWDLTQDNGFQSQSQDATGQKSTPPWRSDLFE